VGRAIVTPQRGAAKENPTPVAGVGC